jgi:catechol 2,3-dioxygenase-like lactoylglutathione lyase family enzyme
VIDHVYLPVADVPRSRAFYRDVLPAIGIEGSYELDGSVGFGVGGSGALWIYPSDGRHGLAVDPCGLRPEGARSLQHIHVAFRVTSRELVHAFVRAARQAGADVSVSPTVLPDYHPTYFAAFVRDPDGHSIEVVCHAAEEARVTPATG